MHANKRNVSIILALAALGGCYAGSDHRSSPQPQAAVAAAGLGAVGAVSAQAGRNPNATGRRRLTNVVAFRVRPTWP